MGTLANNGSSENICEDKLSKKAHILCGWPLFLVTVGGLIGGLMGGLAYGLNIKIYKTKMPSFLKACLNLVVGIIAVAIWFLIAGTASALIHK